MKCPHCQADNREGASFCEQCGNPLVLKCPNCNAELRPTARFCDKCGHLLPEPAPAPLKSPPSEPTSFANGRYIVKKFLGEGGKKKVYLAHDTVLDRDIAFYLIKTEKLDESARIRIKREAQAMGKLGDHPNIMSIFDFGDHEGQPYMVAPLMAGGDVEGLIKKAPDHKLPLEKAIEIAKSVCKGLEFAHAKGVIHRDIKPGNIWMSADGTVKVGDFGLAVAVDLSRLTQDGMMVGTVSYMPPEQAMGGKVTTRADLYSLGAMLYEMVTGRPPFVGDDSVAIIGQHINTPPISPTWHRADLPPALETLIMQLLEKDPEKRPESATVVLQALESIKAGKIKEPSREAPAESPLYRSVFVGREVELKQLQSAFDGAMSGQGALMMVLGEPGIGKTALCERLATYVTLRGGRTLIGHCFEEGSLSLPYLAFVEALRSYVLSREVKDLREELGTGAADVARIVSEIRERLKVKLRPQKDPEEERYRLMQAVTSFLTNAACVQPMMIVLEDLHDADKGTLDMLTHVSRNLAGARLLIVGTYRDVEVDRTHPLSATLAELRRVSSFGRVVLHGLNADEVRRMLEGITQQSVPWSLAEAVHRQTEGNPLFVQEVVRLLVEEGVITRTEGRWRPATDTLVEMSIPEGLRDVIGKRVSLLSKQCSNLLSVASVIGREFRLEVLQKVAGLSDEELFKTLEEAKKTAVIEERARIGAMVTYRFTHAFFRQTLYEETIAPRRIRLHLQIGLALEDIYANRLEEHAAELAEHFSHSSNVADLKKAVTYGEMAARRATEVYAYGEAVRLLEQAIKVQEILDPEDKAKRCDLLLTLCDALYYAPDMNRIAKIEAPAAFSLAESLGDGSRAARACIVAMWANAWYGATDSDITERVRWIERADRYALPDTAERVYADTNLGARKLGIGVGESKTGLEIMNKALDLARRLGDPDALLYIANMLLFVLLAPHQAGERMRLAEELWASPRVGLKNKFWVASALQLIGDSFLEFGQRQRAEEAWGELRSLAKRTGNITIEVLSTGMDSVLALMDGRLDEVVNISDSLKTRGEEAGIAGLAAYSVCYGIIRARLYLGTSLAEFERELRGFTGWLGASGTEMINRLVMSHFEHNKEEVSKTLNRFVVQRTGIGTVEDGTPIWADIILLEAAVLVGHRQSAELLLKRLSGTGVYTPGMRFPTCTLRHLGGAATLLGRYDEACQHYQEAIRVCTEMRFRPELALTHLQLAELLLEHYPDEKKEALEHLDFAIKEFREMKMRPSLERALRHKDILQG